MTSKAEGVTVETQRLSPDYIEALNMRKIFAYQRHTRTSLTAKLPARIVDEVINCTPKPHDTWWGEYKIKIKPKDSNDEVQAWTTEKPERGTAVQFCHHRAGHGKHVYTWFETKNGNPDPDWRSDLA